MCRVRRASSRASSRRASSSVDVLVNNAGFGDVGAFAREDPDRIDAMLQLNVVALTALTRALLPGMLARGRGRVMFVSSTAAFQPGPNMAAYCATKAYVLSLGEALARELRGTGVTLTTLCPGATHSGFASASGADSLPLFTSKLVPKMSAASVARAGYDAMMRGKPVLVTGIMNKLAAFSGRVFPRAVVFPVERLLLGDHELTQRVADRAPQRSHRPRTRRSRHGLCSWCSPQL